MNYAQVPTGNNNQRVRTRNAIVEDQKNLGLELSKNIHNEYGKDFRDKANNNASCYAGLIRSCGCIPQVICCPCAPCGGGPVTSVPTGSIGLLMEFEKVISKLEPGLHTINPCSQKVIVVSLMTQVIDVPVQSLLTKDSVTIYVDAFVTYRVRCAELAIFKVDNAPTLILLLTQGVLKAVVAERDLSDFLVNREEVEKSLTQIIDEKTDPYGIEVLSIETKSVKLPPNMERAMATVAESRKEAEAKVIDAEGNLNSAMIFRKAADELGEGISIKLQYFETLKTIAASNNTTMIIPSTLIDAFAKR